MGLDYMTGDMSWWNLRYEIWVWILIYRYLVVVSGDVSYANYGGVSGHVIWLLRLEDVVGLVAILVRYSPLSWWCSGGAS